METISGETDLLAETEDWPVSDEIEDDANTVGTYLRQSSGSHEDHLSPLVSAEPPTDSLKGKDVQLLLQNINTNSVPYRWNNQYNTM
jgi:hypothetical protein